MITSNRIFQGDDTQWYFHMRGNQAAGPFATAQEAESALSAHVRACKRRMDFSVPWPRQWTPTRLLRAVSAPRHT